MENPNFKGTYYFPYYTIDKPIVDDAIELLSNLKQTYPNDVVELDENNLNQFQNERYFNSSSSHAFLTMKDYINQKSDPESIIKKQFGVVIGVWNNQTKKGFYIPNESYRKLYP